MASASRPESRLESQLGYSFHDAGLLQQALTHTSVELPHMERLEFLGDAVLDMIISEALYSRFPLEQEGKLTLMRAGLVCRAGLLQVAADWDIDPLLNVGPGERDIAGRIRSQSICANAVEAVIGALFLDAGWDVVRAVILRSWDAQLAGADKADGRDAKTRLQEFTQAKDWGLPEYVVSDHGAAQSPRFLAVCRVRGEVVGEGSGERKKIAESEAAKQAWTALNP
ncbi:MAG TPA: ribonuclease III [Zetaproteobacteria bacterium]|nr:ribonuclease III [Zetaproteobacteria bacterium]